MLMYQLLSFLKQRLISACNICPQFVLGIDGRTGSYKTSVTSALFNPIGVTSCSFEDTLASIRRTFQSNQSGITIIDDYKRQTKTNDEKYENITRLSGDIGTTGKRVSGDKVCGDVVTGMSVITGELRPRLQQSSYSRILFVDLNNSPINREYLTLLQNSKPEYTSFLALFIQDIMRCDDFDKSFVECFKEHRNSLIKEEHYQGMHGRYYEMYAWLAAMWDYYVEFLNKSNLQSKVDFDFKNELKAYIYNQHCFYNDDPLILFKKGYVELMNSNEIIIIDHHNIDNLNFDVINYDDKLFIKSNGAYKKICHYWKDNGIDFPCSERELRKKMVEAGILIITNGKTTKEKKTKDNRSYSGYYLYKNYFLNYGGKANDEI